MKASDASLEEENVLGSLGRVHSMHRGEEECSYLFFECLFAQEMWAIHPISRVDISSAWAAAARMLQGMCILIEYIYKLYLVGCQSRPILFFFQIKIMPPLNFFVANLE